MKSPLQQAFYKIELLKREVSRLHDRLAQDIAVIGVAVDFPEAGTPDAFWQNLLTGKKSIRPLPAERKAQVMPHLPAAAVFEEKGYLQTISAFEPAFFGISEKDAALMNPAQRLFLKNAWQVLEDGGYSGPVVSAKNVGVFVGYSGDLAFKEYTELIAQSESALHAASVVGNSSAILPGRISHLLNLRGPSLVIDTACSSSLVAVYEAVKSLQHGGCELAIASGVQIEIFPQAGKYQVGFESADGTMKPFDKNANGTVPGEGVGSVLLKPLQKALEDGDHVYAVIKGGAVNHDGLSSSITAPNGASQTDLLKKAWADARIQPEALTYIETHGTGTHLGDPIELSALTAAMGGRRTGQDKCYAGSVKANLGHLFAGAGIASLIKCVLLIKHRCIPPQISLDQPIDDLLDPACPFVFNTGPVGLPAGVPVLCGISSFGFSGTNCHLVLAAPDTPAPDAPVAPAPALFTLSAKSSTGLLRQIEAFRAFLQGGTPADYRDLCFTRNVGRAHHKYRYAVVVESLAELASQLEAATAATPHPDSNGEKNGKNTAELTRLTREARQLPAEAGEQPDRDRLEVLAAYYRQGADPDWAGLYAGQPRRRVACPGYQWEEKEFWVAAPAAKPTLAAPSGKEDLRSELVRLAAEITGLPASDFQLNAEFFELGVDSLVLLQMIETIKARYNVTLQLGQFYEEIVTLEHLVGYLEKNAVVAPAAAPESAAATVGSTELAEVLRRLERIESKIGDAPRVSAPKALPDTASIYYGLPVLQENRPLQPAQKTFLDGFIRDYQRKTAGSKSYSAGHRAHFADWINSIDYRHSLKELLYPIVSERAEGAKVWDVDGNEYIDIGLGYGISFFGNNPPFIKKALAAQLETGFELAFQTKLAGDIAADICALTGVERVTFSNTGTEAVMAAVRMARAKTRKPRIVIFTGSYHGTFDGVLGMKGEGDHPTVPISAGTPSGFMEDLLVLNFGAQESLDIIAAQAGNIAGVLMEPVQSRKPDVHLGDYIRQLRALTERLDIALIFDEIITGFRIGPGGAQAHFGVQADLVTYGKVIGGGMPLGIVAGKRAFMDLIDGGDWHFGDDSYPAVKKVLFGGTFCKHPLALAAAAAVIRKIKTEGDVFYARVNGLADYLRDTLNDFFQAEEMPIALVNFGALFRFEFKGKYQALNNPPEIPVFFYLLNYHGIYTWERRICFLSTEHTQTEVDQIIRAVKRTVEVMKSHGWFEGTANREAAPAADLKPLFHAQMRLWMLDQINAGQQAYNLGFAYKVEGDFRADLLESAFNEVLRRHEVLRGNVVLRHHSPMLRIRSAADFAGRMAFRDLSDQPESAVEDLLKATVWEKFDIENDPLIRLQVIKRDHVHYIALSVHHLVADGWSVNVLMTELGQLYQRLSVDPAAVLPAPGVTYLDLLAEEGVYLQSKQLALDQAFWLEQLGGDLPKLDFPLYKKRPVLQSNRGKMCRYAFPRPMTAFLIELARKEKVSLYTVLLGLVKIVLHKYTRQEDLIVGTSVHGRKSSDHYPVVGNFINNIALRSRVSPEERIHDFLQALKRTLFDAFEHQYYPFDLLVEHLHPDRDLSRSPVFDVLVQIESGDLAAYYQAGDLFAGLQLSPVEVEDDSAERDLFIEFVHQKDDLSVKINYNTDVFEDFQIPLLFAHLQQVILGVQQNGTGGQIGDLDLLLPAEKAFLDAVNRTGKPFPAESHFVEIFENQAREYPGAPALQSAEGTFSYADLNGRANRLARYLQREGPAAPFIGLLMPRGAQLVAAILAVWKAGKAYVPIDPDYPAPRIADIVGEAALGVVLTAGLPPAVASGLETDFSANVRWIDFGTAETEAEWLPDENPATAIDPRDPAYVIFTSGSTGKPKGAIVEHAGMLNHLCAKVNDLELGKMLLPVTAGQGFPLNAIQRERWEEYRNPAFQAAATSRRAFAWHLQALNPAVLERAFDALLREFPFLTSRFECVDGVVVRTESPQNAHLVLRTDVLFTPDGEVPAFFPLPGCHFQAALFGRREGGFVLYYYLHELIAAPEFLTTIDGQLRAHYAAGLASGQPGAGKSELSYSFPATADPAFVEWLAQNLRDYQRPAFNIGRFNHDQNRTEAVRAERTFDADTIQKLRACAGRLQFSVEELLFSAVGLLVHKYTGSEQVALDVAFDGHAGGIPQTNYLPLLLHAGKTETVENAVGDFVRRYRRLAEGKNHTYSEWAAEMAEPPVFAVEKNVLFRYQTGTRPDELPVARHDSFYALEFAFTEAGDAFKLRLSANEYIIGAVLAVQILEHAETIVRQITDHPEQPVARLEYLGVQEKARILHEFNRQYPPYAGDGIIRLFERNARQAGAHPAVIFEGRRLSYDQVNRKANQLARLLTDRFGTRAGSKVAILMDRSEHMLIALLAVLKTGGAYVPLDVNFPEERMRFILTDAQTDLLIMEGAHLPDLPAEGLPPMLRLTDVRADLADYDEENGPDNRSPEHLFAILYTSGTTGLPKGVLIRDHGLSSLLDWGLDAFRHDPFEHVLACTAICFDVSMFELFFPLVKGKTLVFIRDEFTMENFQEELNAYPKIALHTSPTFIGALLEEGVDMRNVSAITMAGEAVPVSFRRIFKGKDVEVRNLYGPCETTVYSSGYFFDDEHEDIMPIGKPLRHEQMYIVDDQMMLAPIGAIGEICIAGAGVSTGYLNLPELTAEKFVDAPFAPGTRMYRTGDFGRFLPDGNLEYLGRRDNQVKISGYRIELGEIENTLNGMDRIITSCVMLATDQQGNNHLLAYYLASDGITENEVRDYLVNTLPYFMVPAYIIRMDAFPKTINGKVDKGRLPKPARLGSQTAPTPEGFKRSHRAIYRTQSAPAVVAQNASHCFDISVWQMFVAHLVGGKTVVYENDLIMDALALIRSVERDGITVLELVPSYLNLVLTLFEERKLDPAVWNRLAWMISTGEELKANLVNRWFKIFPGIPLVNAYGPTEASDDITHHILYQPVGEQRLVPVGRPVQNMQIFVLDERRRPCPVGVKGRLHVSGIGVGQGYIHQPEKTAAVFFPSPFDPATRMYDTGDVGRYLPDGRLEFYGRQDTQIKIRGNRIELGEIDAALTAIPHVREAVTALRKIPDADPVLVSYVTCRQKTEPSFIRNELAGRIPLLPDEIVVLEAFPLNANGKVDRKALLNLSAPGVAAVKDQETAAPVEGGDVAGALRQFWAEVLGHRAFGDTDSFFEQGGNSLKLMKLYRLIDDRFPDKIRVPDLFRKVTIADQTRLLAGDAPAAVRGQEKIVELDF